MRRTSWFQMGRNLLEQSRHRLRLRTGLRRLRRWKSRLQPLLLAMRMELNSPTEMEQSQVLTQLRLPQGLPMHRDRLLWAMQTTEDLYFLVENLEKETTQLLSEMSPRS
jgi:hypothetical protein